MSTQIISDGSPWADAGGIDKLLELLATYPLDRVFEDYGNFVFPDDTAPGKTRIWGNFFNYSHVFDIQTDDAAVITKLIAAINANTERADYKAQPAPLSHEARMAAFVERTIAARRGAR